MERLGEMQIFNGVDFQRMVNRFTRQREEIRAARQGETVAVSKDEKSIHDTWLEVLHLSPEGLEFSKEEIDQFVKYFQAVRLLIDCKDAAVRVSPDVWAGIEDGLFRPVE